MKFYIKLHHHFIFQFLAKKAVNRLGYGFQAPEEIKAHPFFRALEWEKVENREEEPPIKPTLVRRTISDIE